jgi:hypothetical protein
VQTGAAACEQCMVNNGGNTNMKDAAVFAAAAKGSYTAARCSFFLIYKTNIIQLLT